MWIRIDLMRIRDPAFFLIADPDPDPVLNPGFRWPKIEKKFTAEKNGYFFAKKLQFSYHKASIKDAHAKGEALKKKNIQHFKK